MLARITYALVIVAVGTLIGGFFTRDSNVLLFVAIGLSVAAIALVIVGWAQRGRDALSEDADLAFDDEDEDVPLDDELAFVEQSPRVARRSGSASKARPASKPKAKPKAKPATGAARKPKPTSGAKPRSSSKPKPKAKGTARPKRKPPRKPPGTP